MFTEKKNKKILITGASGDLGKEISLYLAKNGYDLVLHCSKNEEKLALLVGEVEKFNVSAQTISFDISNREEIKDKLNNMPAFYGIVLNAGIVRDNPFPLMEENEWDSVINVNLNGFYNVLKPCIMPMLQKREGRIVVMTSVSGLSGNRGQVNYSASKAGLIGAAKALSRECAKRGVTVNCVAPGIIKSKMTENIPDEFIKENVPMKRKGNAKEVASAVNYLMSEDAGYITGQVISVNGGLYV